MKKYGILTCAFVLASLGMKAQSQGNPISIPGTREDTGELGNTVVAKCKGNVDVCCLIMTAATAPNGPGSVTLDRKTYSFNSWSSKNDGKGNNELTFKDAKLK